MRMSSSHIHSAPCPASASVYDSVQAAENFVQRQLQALPRDGSHDWWCAALSPPANCFKTRECGDRVLALLQAHIQSPQGSKKDSTGGGPEGRPPSLFLHAPLSLIHTSRLTRAQVKVDIAACADDDVSPCSGGVTIGCGACSAPARCARLEVC